MSGIFNSSINGSTSNIADSSGRSFTTSFTGQSTNIPGFNQSVLHNIFNLPNVHGSLSGNASLSGMQQTGGSISTGRFASNNIPAAVPQMPHGHSGVTNRGGLSVGGNPAFSGSMNPVGGSILGLSSNMASGNRSAVPGLSGSTVLGNLGPPRMTNPVNSMVGEGTVGRSMNPGGMSVAGIASRLNMASKGGSGSLTLQGSNRFIGGMLQQAPQLMNMHSYHPSGGGLSQNQGQLGNSSLSSMGVLHDMNSSESSPFDINNDFPQLPARPSSSGGPQGQFGSLRKGIGVNTIVQQSHEFSIQNEDFPALPGFKGSNSDYSMDVHQKEQLQENAPTIQTPNYPMARSSGFNLAENYQASRQQHLQNSSGVPNSFASANNQNLLHLHSSDFFTSSHGGAYHPQSIGMRPHNSGSPSPGASYEQLMQQQQFQQSKSPVPPFRLAQMSPVSQPYREQQPQQHHPKPFQDQQNPPDPYSLQALLNILRKNDPDLSFLAVGMDLTTLGMNLNTPDHLHKTFASPWSTKPAKGEPDFHIPNYYLTDHPLQLHPSLFSKFTLVTLFYIFYSMPKDESQLLAANELYSRDWFYHRDQQLWLKRIPNVEPLVKTPLYERAAYACFDPNTWEVIRKDNVVVHYDAIEKLGPLPSSSSQSFR